MVQCWPELQQPPRPSVQGSWVVAAQEGVEMVLVVLGGTLATQPDVTQTCPKAQQRPPSDKGHW